MTKNNLDIRLVERDDIDDLKWNSCVHYANNGNVFGYCWYLDNVAHDWVGLVEGDYESVMPLPYKTDWLKRNELIQPELMRELGIYSIHVLSKERLRQFWEALPTRFRKSEIVFNEQNHAIKELNPQVEMRYNHQLLLEPKYEDLANAYSRPVLLELEKASQAGLIPTNNVKPEQVAEFSLQHAGISQKSFHALHRIMYNALHRGWGNAVGVENDRGELLAANFFIYSHHKALSLCPAVSQEGKTSGALPFLFNMFILTHAERPMILDFNQMSDVALVEGLGGAKTSFFAVQQKKFMGVL